MQVTKQQVTIPSGTGGSAAVDLREFEVSAIQFPGTFTSTAITLTGCDELGGTYVAVSDSGGAAISLTVANSKLVVLTEAHKAALKAMRYAKFVNGSSEGADRTIILYLVPIG